MATKFLSNIDMVANQIVNHVLHIIAGDPGSPVEGQVWYNGSTDRLKYRTASDTRTPWTASGDIPAGEIANDRLATNPLARDNHTGSQLASTISDFDTQVRTSRLDQMAVPTAAVSFNSQRITSVATPTTGTDAANKDYVDNTVAGLSWKDEVRVATTAAGTLASSFENADVIDGVTLATGDRILIKDQAAGAENGIYTVNASGAPTRALDANTAAEIQGSAVYVANGTTNGGTRWVNNNTGTITLGTTALTFVQFGGGSSYTAGDGLTLTANDFDVNVGNGIVISSDAVAVDPAVVVRKFASDIGNGSLTAITVTHNLNTKDITWAIRTVSDDSFVIADAVATTVNTATFTFAVAPTTNQYRVIIHG
jgi:hypothetical protein